MRLSVLTILIGSLLTPAPAGAWGFEAHRFIMAHAIELLPAPIRPFFDANRNFIVEHSVDPDLWRSAGFTEESPRHFLDLDAYGSYPFNDLPREHRAALKKFGPEALARNGLLPWRTAEMVDKLRSAFRPQRGSSSYALDDVKFFSAVIGHYVADGHVPFHAALNYDGQLTKQSGIHARFETDLFVRYERQLVIKFGPLKTIVNPTELMFEILLESFQLNKPVLDADREAIGSRAVYDDRYYEAFFVKARPVLERRLSDAITAVASVIASAWEQAGRPTLPVRPARPV